MEPMTKPPAPDEFLQPPPIINEAALQEAYRVGQIDDDDTRRIVRWAILVYETAKARFPVKNN
jgi:hypothetical protein